MEKVDHSVPANGYIVEDREKAAIAYTGDTGPTERFWKRMAGRDVKALITETSFPNRLEKLALASGHLTPDLLGEGDREDVPAAGNDLHHAPEAAVRAGDRGGDPWRWGATTSAS